MRNANLHIKNNSYYMHKNTGAEIMKWCSGLNRDEYYFVEIFCR